jgi:hypothetical protein
MVVGSPPVLRHFPSPENLVSPALRYRTKNRSNEGPLSHPSCPSILDRSRRRSAAAAPFERTVAKVLPSPAPIVRLSNRQSGEPGGLVMSAGPVGLSGLP